MEDNVAELTVSGADPVTPAKVAEIEGAPAETPVATPTLPEVLLMVAAAVLLAQVTSWEMS